LQAEKGGTGKTTVATNLAVIDRVLFEKFNRAGLWTLDFKLDFLVVPKDQVKSFYKGIPGI
jgi:hypothetical protein